MGDTEGANSLIGEMGGATSVAVRATVDGSHVEEVVEARLLLVHWLRDRLGLTGVHIGCNTSHCGACAVLLDGSPVKSCTVLAAQADGTEILTVEGLTPEDGLHPIQEAFHEEHALQCGFCTPGFIVASVALLGRNANPTEEEIRRALCGNLCRCTGYHNIVRAVRRAARELGGEE